jgi:Ca-activated chloride channel family protein
VQRITEVIESLEAEGKTAGEAGLKQAYKICERYYIEGGNNHVYLATDGSFNKGSEKIMKMVSSKAKKDMYLSVLSIRSSRWVDEKMQDLAGAGSGQHLSIQDEADQGALKDLVKELSRR